MSETEDELRESAASHGWTFDKPLEIFELVPPESLLDDEQQQSLLYYLMPGMNGVDLVQAAGNLVPSLPALLITGYSNIASGPGAALPRLAKPFRQVDLAARVAELLVQRDADVVPIRTARRNQP